MRLLTRLAAAAFIGLTTFSATTAFAAGTEDGSSVTASVGTFVEAKGLVY